MLLTVSIAQAVARGDVTVAYRRWARSRVSPGSTFRSVAGVIRVDSVDDVTGTSLTDEDARAAGYPDRAALIATFRGAPGDPVYRIGLSWAGPDERHRLADDDALAADEIARIDARLASLDRRTPWTRPVLAAIARRPGVVSGELAAELSMTKDSLKRRIRHLKELGLTTSLPTGYELSRRGRAYLATGVRAVAENDGA